ncbi:MAG: hypothetical protein AB8B55_03325 [Mariniblastus sp.]
MLIRSVFVTCLVIAFSCVAIFNSGEPSENQATSKQMQRSAMTGNSTATSDFSRNSAEKKSIKAAANRAANLNRCIAGLNSWSMENPSIAQAAEKQIVIPVMLRKFDDASRIQLVTYTSTASSNDSGEESEPALIPVSPSLIGEIEKLQSNTQSARWATSVIAILDAISKSSTDSVQLATYFNQLETLLGQTAEISNAIWNADRQSKQAMIDASEVGRVSYQISRRLAIWQSIKIAQSQMSRPATGKFGSVGFNRISFSELDPRWVEYLKLEDYKIAFESLNPDPVLKRKTAREILSRIYSPVLQPEQAAYVSQVVSPDIIEVLKIHASEEVAPEDLLDAIERFESNNSARSGNYLNGFYQSLLWSDSPESQAVASELQSHYRNANFRMAVSERLLNRMIPVLPSTAQPVSENIKGAVVSGQSHVSNQMRISLEPNAHHLALRLETEGQVRADTVARTKTFRILNQGDAQFQVHKRLLFGMSGIDSSEKPFSVSAANQQVVGVESKLDNIPIFGWVARRLAEKKLREDAPETNRMFRKKVNDSAETRVEEEVEKGLAKLRQYTYANLVQPLVSMDLDPEPVQLATTQDQLIMRYRLAGRDQMAANTARPRDNGDSLLSFQLHQSMINNAIARIGLNGEEFSGQELKDHIREVFGAPPQETFTDEESEKEVQIKFATFDPVHVGFENDRFAVTLNLKSLKVGEKGKRLKNISMTAVYAVRSSGMEIFLTQDDSGTLIRGKRLKLLDKASISTVMKVLFKQNYNFQTLPAQMAAKINGQNLEVSQLVVSNGWIGVSIDDRGNSANNFADQQETEAQPPQRFSNLRKLLSR